MSEGNTEKNDYKNCYDRMITNDTGKVGKICKKERFISDKMLWAWEKEPGNNLPGIASQFAMHFLYECYTRYFV